MSDFPTNSAEKHLINDLDNLLKDRSLVVCITSLFAGAGKTTLAKKLSSQFGERACVIDDDSFIFVPTQERKKFIHSALESKDIDRLRYLANPKHKAENPYANPTSWVDWWGVRRCLTTLKAGNSFEQPNAWNQKTGECNQHIVYNPPAAQFPLYIVDAYNSFKYEDLIDLLVFIDIPPKIAADRHFKRDSHRSSMEYIDYHQMVAIKWRAPYLVPMQKYANYVLSVSESDQISFSSTPNSGPYPPSKTPLPLGFRTSWSKPIR
ncbi:MAG: hypothetical protein PHX43_08990 [Alphaproteobacteria bacterium]|nr:hypothetical protein [Alphaproteobacteria bacterium]